MLYVIFKHFSFRVYYIVFIKTSVWYFTDIAHGFIWIRKYFFTHFYLKIGSTVEDIKKNLAETIGIDCYYIDIVCLEDGIIYENDRNIDGISRPLQVMVGNPVRKIPTYLVTSEPDMIYQDVNDEEPRLKMSCGHAISKKISL